jgi:hypothetical protein
VLRLFYLFSRKATVVPDVDLTDDKKIVHQNKYNVRLTKAGTEGVVYELVWSLNPKIGSDQTVMGMFSQKKYKAVIVPEGEGKYQNGTVNLGVLLWKFGDGNVVVVQDSDAEDGGAKPAEPDEDAEADLEVAMGKKVDVVHKGDIVAHGSVMAITDKTMVNPMVSGTTLFGHQKLGVEEVHVCITTVVNRAGLKSLLGAKTKAFVPNPTIAVGDFTKAMSKLDAEPIKIPFNLKYVFVCSEFDLKFWRVFVN